MAPLALITLPDRDLIYSVRLFLISCPMGNWALMKGDGASAYKNIPPRPAGDSLSVASLRDDSAHRRRVLEPRALLFDATAAVLRYNTCHVSWKRLLTAYSEYLYWTSTTTWSPISLRCWDGWPCARLRDPLPSGIARMVSNRNGGIHFPSSAV